MARGRIILKKISVSHPFNNLPSDTARMAFLMCIPHLDIDGRIIGEPDVLKAIILPFRKDISVKKFEKIIKSWTEMMNSDKKNALVMRYEVHGVRYLQFVNFEENQLNLRRDREAPSVIPPYLPDYCGSKSSTNSGSNSGSSAGAAPPLSLSLSLSSSLSPSLSVLDDEPCNVTTQPYIDILKTVRGYKFNEETDTEMVESLINDFPTVNVLDVIKTWALNKKDKPLSSKDSPRAQIRNWCKKQVEINARPSSNGNGRRLSADEQRQANTMAVLDSFINGEVEEESDPFAMGGILE